MTTWVDDDSSRWSMICTGDVDDVAWDIDQ